jgi:hypothetical protein
MVWPNNGPIGDRFVTNKPPPSPDPKGIAPMQVSATAPASHLAHWPPPMRGQHSKATITIHHPGEPVKHNLRARGGWRLTRGTFAEFEGEE